MTNIGSLAMCYNNDSQLKAFLRERAHATRGIYSCVEKALGYLIQLDLGTSSQLAYVKSALCTLSQLSAR